MTGKSKQPQGSLERRAFSLTEFKASDETPGVFEGYLAVFSNVDEGGDTIEPGAFKKSLSDLEIKQRSQNTPYILPIFWQHDPSEPIGGFVTAHEDEHGLYVKGQLDLDIPQGVRAHSGMKHKYITGMSIGYITVKQGYSNGVRLLKEIRLLEGSIVSIPMNPEAQVTGVKQDRRDAPKGMPADMKARDFDTLFQSLAQADDLQDEWGDMFIAFTHAMSELMWQQHAQVNGWLAPDAPTVDAAEAVQANLDAFSAALLDLVARSVAADFAPSLDRDGDQFLDPDGCNAEDDEDTGYMSATPEDTKAGRVMSASNHEAMGKSLGEMGASLKALNDLHKRMAPQADTEPSATGDDTQDGAEKSLDTGAGAGAAPSALDGQTTPDNQSDDQLSEGARVKLLMLRADMLRHQLEKAG